MFRCKKKVNFTRPLITVCFAPDDVNPLPHICSVAVQQWIHSDRSRCSVATGGSQVLLSHRAQLPVSDVADRWMGAGVPRGLVLTDSSAFIHLGCLQRPRQVCLDLCLVIKELRLQKRREVRVGQSKSPRTDVLLSAGVRRWRTKTRANITFGQKDWSWN